MVKMERKPRDLRFGNLVNEPDEIKKGQYVPWARKQKPGGVKEITFQAESRRCAHPLRFEKHADGVCGSSLDCKETRRIKGTGKGDEGNEGTDPEMRESMHIPSTVHDSTARLSSLLGRAYLTGFRKRKTERSKVAKKNIVDKEAREKR